MSLKDQVQYLISFTGFIATGFALVSALILAVGSGNISEFLLYFSIFVGLLFLTVSKLYEYGFGYWYSYRRGYSLTYRLQYVCKIGRVVYGYLFILVLITFLVAYLLGY
jgi:hypothetical protein